MQTKTSFSVRFRGNDPQNAYCSCGGYGDRPFGHQSDTGHVQRWWQECFQSAHDVQAVGLCLLMQYLFLSQDSASDEQKASKEVKRQLKQVEEKDLPKLESYREQLEIMGERGWFCEYGEYL